MRHIYSLCETSIGEDPVSVRVKDTIKAYLSQKLSNADLMMFLRVAEILDPRYHELSCDDSSPVLVWLKLPKLEEIKSYILENAPEILNSSRKNSDCQSQIQKDDQPSKKKGKKTLTDLLVPTSTSSPNYAQPEVAPEVELKEKLEREFDFYVRLKAGKDEDVLQWWKSHRVELPLLSCYARYVLSSCASSVPSERLFSISGNIISKRRNALKPQLVDQLVFLAMNKDMIR